jgi:hypothetical protein
LGIVRVHRAEPHIRAFAVLSLVLHGHDGVIGKRGYVSKTLERDQPADAAFLELFEEAAHQLTRSDQPRGCMLTLALHNCSPELEPLRSYLNERRSAVVDTFEMRLRAAQKNSELSAKTDVRGLAWFLANTLQGMSLQARAGTTRKDLLQIGRWAMKAWPPKTI